MESMTIVLGTREDDRLDGTAGDDIILGFGGADRLFGGRGADLLLGGAGRDRLFGGNGADSLLGGAGQDVLVGGRGNDLLFGNRGADRFLFDPSDPNLGRDVIADFSLAGGDVIVLNAADIYRSDRTILGEDQAFQAADVDESAGYALDASEDGFLTVFHPGGSIEVRGVPFSPELSFVALASLGAVDVTGLVAGANDMGRLVSQSGDDLLVGTNGTAEIFFFNPNNPLLGDDIIVNFELGSDQILLNAAQVFRADPNILGADGIFSPTDFDDSEAFSLTASETGDLVVEHPGGTIEVVGVPFSPDLTFTDLVRLDALGIEGLAINDGTDRIGSRSGDDLIVGTIGASEVFFFDPSNPNLGNDIIANFEVGSDQIVLNAADVVRSSPDILGEDGMFSAEDFDASDDFNLVASPRGNLVAVHPGGSIEIAGLAFSEDFTFAGLVELGAIGLEGLTTPVPLNETDALLNTRAFLPPDFPVLIAGVNDELLVADGAMEALDLIFFDISERAQADDVIANFDVTQDIVLFDAADLFRILGNEALSDDGALTASDLDESDAFDLVASDLGNLTIVYPTGSIELLDVEFFDGVDFSFVAQNVLGLTGFVSPDANGFTPSGPGDEFLEGVSGLAQAFVFDPSDPQLGEDVIGELIVGEDQIVLDLDGVLAVDPHIAGRDGILTAEDFDASDAFDLGASDRGNLIVLHPGGTIEIASFAFSEDLTFAGLASAGALAVQDFGDAVLASSDLTDPANIQDADIHDAFVML